MDGLRLFVCAIIIFMDHKGRFQRYKAHIQKEGDQSTISSYFTEIVYGGIDGIITTFAIVAGFSGAALSNETTTQLSFLIVLLFGLANLFADGVSMGLGNFLSVRSDKSLFEKRRAKEQEALRTHKEIKKDHTKVILMSKGFNAEDAETLASIYEQNESYWTDFVMQHERLLSDPSEDNPLYTGFATFAAFVVFGFIPLLPFILFAKADPQSVFVLSSFFGLIALVLLGILKWRITGANFFSAVLEVVLIGTVAGGIAFFVGSLFSI